jgi:hypothetical protein
MKYNNHMHSDSKKRRSFVALLFAAGDVKRWASTPAMFRSSNAADRRLLSRNRCLHSAGHGERSGRSVVLLAVVRSESPSLLPSSAVPGAPAAAAGRCPSLHQPLLVRQAQPVAAIALASAPRRSASFSARALQGTRLAPAGVLAWPSQPASCALRSTAVSPPPASVGSRSFFPLHASSPNPAVEGTPCRPCSSASVRLARRPSLLRWASSFTLRC